MTNEVKYAPKAVIEELDKLEGIDMVYGLSEQGAILDANNFSDDFNKVAEWVYRSDSELSFRRELAVINHYLGIERLQPERETCWTVEKEINGYTKSLVFEGNETNFRSYTTDSTYMFGLTEEKARGYAELFGGEPKEIK